MKHRSRGTALVIALLIVSVIAGMAFGIGKIVLSGISFTSGQEDSTVALSAAEAGIEDGIFRWKNKNDIDYPAGATRDTKEVRRVNLTDGNYEVNPVNPETTKPDSAKKTYDLKIWRWADFIGTESQGRGRSNFDYNDLFTANFPASGYRPKLKAEEYHFDIRKIAAPGDNDMNLYWNYEQEGAGRTMHIEVTGGAVDKIKDYSDLFPYCNNGPGEPSCHNNDGDYVYNVNNLLDSLGIRGQNYTTLKIVPNANVYFGIKPVNVDTETIGDAFSHIESTGYFGSAKRHLSTEIKRP